MLTLTFFNAQVMFLLVDPNMFAVSTDKIGYVAGLLVSVAAPFSIIAALVAGYVYEICGRKKTILVCLLIASGTLFVTPWTSPYLVPWLFIVKCA
jgi:MFS family permease